MSVNFQPIIIFLTFVYDAVVVVREWIVYLIGEHLSLSQSSMSKTSFVLDNQLILSANTRPRECILRSYTEFRNVYLLVSCHHWSQDALKLN